MSEIDIPFAPGYPGFLPTETGGCYCVLDRKQSESMNQVILADRLVDLASAYLGEVAEFVRATLGFDFHDSQVMVVYFERSSTYENSSV